MKTTTLEVSFPYPKNLLDRLLSKDADHIVDPFWRSYDPAVHDMINKTVSHARAALTKDAKRKGVSIVDGGSDFSVNWDARQDGLVAYVVCRNK